MINQEVIEVLTIRLLAIVSILEKKGILNSEEFDKEISYATSLFDQAISREKEKLEQDMKEENPDAYRVMKFLANIFGEK